MAEVNKGRADEQRAQVSAFLTVNHLTQLWLACEIQRLTGETVDPSSVSLALTGRRSGGRYGWILDSCERVVRKYESTFLRV